MEVRIVPRDSVSCNTVRPLFLHNMRVTKRLIYDIQRRDETSISLRTKCGFEYFVVEMYNEEYVCATLILG